MLWADSFTNGMNPEVARAAVAVLQDAGYRVIVPDQVACCGLTWITTGQLDGAKKRLRRLLDILGPYAAAGHSDRRAGTVLYRGAALRPGRPAAGRSAIRAGGRRDQDPGRTADQPGRGRKCLAAHRT